MNQKSVVLLLLSILLFLLSCSTGPDFKRDNPYDRNPIADSLGILQFPPSFPNKYVFTGSGLKLNVLQNSPRFGENIILRRNGSLEYHTIDTIQVFPSDKSDFSEHYLDTEIKHPEDIGYPLSYGLVSTSTNSTKYVEIEFGSIQNLKESTDSEKLIISWQDSVFLNNGFQVLRKKDDQIYDFIDLPVPKNSFSIPFTEENLTSEYLISPYTLLQGEKTFLDTTYYFPTSPPPKNLNFEIISGNKFKLSWNDNSSIENSYKIIDNSTNQVYDLPANQESIVIEEKLSPFDTKSFTILAMLNNRPSTPIKIDTTIPDFPYPKITEIKHVNENSLEIYFEDPVNFERQIYFTTSDPNNKFVVNNDKGFATISFSDKNESFDINFSADVSYGDYGNKYIPISKRPSLETLAKFEVGINSSPETIDMRTIGDILVFNSENHIYKINLTNLESQPSLNISLPANINLLRLSNDNSKAFASTTENIFYLIDVVNSSYEKLNNIPNNVYDVSFIEDDTKIVLSTNNGLIIYSLKTNQYSRLNGFDTTAELIFSGDASQTLLLALDKENYKIHYFNTMGEFNYYDTVTLDSREINGIPSELTNVSHLNATNNVVGYEIGGAVEFQIGQPDCNFNNFACFNGFYSFNEEDSNGFLQILDSEFRLASFKNSLRILYKPNLDNYHVIEREPANVSMLKVNYDTNVAVEFHEDIMKLVLYDLSKKWSFTNYGVYSDLVYPSN